MIRPKPKDTSPSVDSETVSHVQVFHQCEPADPFREVVCFSMSRSGTMAAGYILCPKKETAWHVWHQEGGFSGPLGGIFLKIPYISLSF